jgi:hypothetical protein
MRARPRLEAEAEPQWQASGLWLGLPIPTAVAMHPHIGCLPLVVLGRSLVATGGVRLANAAAFISSQLPYRLHCRSSSRDVGAYVPYYKYTDGKQSAYRQQLRAARGSLLVHDASRMSRRLEQHRPGRLCSAAGRAGERASVPLPCHARLPRRSAYPCGLTRLCICCCAAAPVRARDACHRLPGLHRTADSLPSGSAGRQR